MTHRSIVFFALVAAGCSSPSAYDGEPYNGLLDTDGDLTPNCVDDDDDGDGTDDGDDCAPLDASIHPGAVDICDGVDTDCEYESPLGDYDDDQDGFLACEDDCDDTLADVNPDADEQCDFVDHDCDGDNFNGFPDVDGNGQADCLDVDADGDGFVAGDDCDDTDPNINPDVTEICDEEDNDCDGLVDDADDTNPGAVVINDPVYEDLDGDGFGNSAISAFLCPTDGWSGADGDCDDTDINFNPSRPEECDLLDWDCDGDLVDQYPDTDGDGIPGCGEDLDGDGSPDDEDCDDSDSAVNPGADEVCNGVDDDCDGDVDDDDPDVQQTVDWWQDNDGDGFGDPSMASFHGCDPGTGWVQQADDCDDSDAARAPGAPEVCDGLDNDCDAVVPGDELDVDADLVSECEGDCDDSDADVYPGHVADVCDGVDADCDPDQPAGDVDADGDGVPLCDGDCDDEDAAVHPGVDELCDAVDWDCDGEVYNGLDDLDEDGDPDCVDDDIDGDGTDNDEDCDDEDASVHPGAPDDLCDGVDSNCDGTVFVEGTDLDEDGDGFTPCGGDCNDEQDTVYPDAPPLCDSLDNNCDGWVADFTRLNDDGSPACPDQVEIEPESCVSIGCGTPYGFSLVLPLFFLGGVRRRR